MSDTSSGQHGRMVRFAIDTRHETIEHACEAFRRYAAACSTRSGDSQLKVELETALRPDGTMYCRLFVSGFLPEALEVINEVNLRVLLRDNCYDPNDKLANLAFAKDAYGRTDQEAFAGAVGPLLS